MEGLVEFFDKVIQEDYRNLVWVYKFNEPRNPRDDNLDTYSSHNMVCTLLNKTSTGLQRYALYDILNDSIRRRGTTNIICDQQLISVEMDPEARNLDLNHTKIKHLTEGKKHNTPFKLTHLSAATVINNSKRYDVKSLVELYLICSNSEKIGHLAFRAGYQDYRRVYNITSILKNLIYPRLLYRTIQSEDYYDNLKINLRPYCTSCNGMIEFTSTCPCSVCEFVRIVFFTNLTEINGHFGSCIQLK